MPKNKGKGGKNRRRGKNENDIMKRELIEKDSDNQAYAQVMKMLGNGRLTAFCFDGKTRLCHIRGKLRKKVWINTGDIILVGLRDYQDDKADVILKYTPDEARILKNSGQLPESAKLNEIGEEENGGEVEFVDSGEHDLADEVSIQDRDYIITSSESESDSDSDDESTDVEEGDPNKPQQPKRAPAPAATVATTTTTKNSNKGVAFKKAATAAKSDSSSSGEESSSDSEESDSDPELSAQRAAAAANSSYKKPGARDRHTAGGHARGKGKRGK